MKNKTITFRGLAEAEGRRSHFDPRVLNAFTSVSRDLYAALAGREDQVLKDTLGTDVQRYFNADTAIQPEA